MFEIEDLKRARTYFIELEDALSHNDYSGIEHITISGRTDLDGQILAANKSYFPALEDFTSHVQKLLYAAERLDLIMPEFWKEMQLTTYRLKLPYIAAQIIHYGTSNGSPLISEHAKFRENWINESKLLELLSLSVTDRNEFTFQAVGDIEQLQVFSRTESTHWSSYRDRAEECFRILNAYIIIYEHFGQNGVPEELQRYAPFEQVLSL